MAQSRAVGPGRRRLRDAAQEAGQDDSRLEDGLGEERRCRGARLPSSRRRRTEMAAALRKSMTSGVERASTMLGGKRVDVFLDSGRELYAYPSRRILFLSRHTRNGVRGHAEAAAVRLRRSRERHRASRPRRHTLTCWSGRSVTPEYPHSATRTAIRIAGRRAKRRGTAAAMERWAGQLAKGGRRLDHLRQRRHGREPGPASSTSWAPRVGRPLDDLPLAG